MIKCAEPRCPNMVDEGLCYYHLKLTAGLLDLGLLPGERAMAEYDQGIRDYMRRYPDRPSSARARHHVLESGVVDDEQREISSTLQVLGADELTIRSAFSRKRPRLVNVVRHR